MFRSRHEAGLLSRIDAFRAGSEIDSTAKTDFDEGDSIPVLHYQIDFTVPATIIPCYQTQAVVD
jgi:hypothetical protein